MSEFYNFLITEFRDVLRALPMMLTLGTIIYVINRDLQRDIQRDMEEERKSKIKKKK